MIVAASVKYFTIEDETNTRKTIPKMDGFMIGDIISQPVPVYVGVVRSYYQGKAFLYTDRFPKSKQIYAKHSYLPTGVFVRFTMIDSYNADIIDVLSDTTCILFAKYSVRYMTFMDDELLFPTEKYRDHRHLQTFTIDPLASVDLDDALSFTEDRVYVHIASFRLGKVSDKHAFDEQFTVYLPDGETLPLLPKDMTAKYSLLPNEERPTLTVEFDHNMNLIDIYPSIIINKKRHTYGSIDMFPFKVDVYPSKFNQQKYIFTFKDGKLVSWYPDDDHHISHKYIEYFMVKTNVAVAQYLKERGILYPKRVHPPPISPERELDVPDEVKEILKIKTQAFGYYTPSNSTEQHYGLDLDCYCHFTSPLRRYMDQIIHRLIAGEDIKRDELGNAIMRANARERMFDKLEKEFIWVKFIDFIIDHPDTVLDGWITRISAWGISFITPMFGDEFSMHVSTLSSSRLEFKDNSLFDKDIKFTLGQHIRYSAKKVDTRYQTIEWIIDSRKQLS
jgi:ribonuclease R